MSLARAFTLVVHWDFLYEKLEHISSSDIGKSCSKWLKNNEQCCICPWAVSDFKAHPCSLELA